MTLRYILSYFDQSQLMITEQEFVINYNYFYWTNLAVKIIKLFLAKYGYERSEQEERAIDEITAPLITLIFAYRLVEFPSWASVSKAELISGQLLAKIKKL